MLEFFRRHRGTFLIVLTSIIIISFSVWGGWRSGSAGIVQAGDGVLTIYGRDYSKAEFERDKRAFGLAQYLGLFDLSYRLPYLYQKYGQLAGQTGSMSDDVVNLIVLRQQMERLGIVVSDDEARAELEKLPRLQENGKFDPKKGEELQALASANGFTVSDILEVVKAQVGLDKIRNIVSANFAPSPIAVSKTYASRHQTVKLATIDFDLESFKKQAKVTDDEIKKSYDEKKDGFKTPEKRAVSHITFEEPKDAGKHGPEIQMAIQNDFGKKVNQFYMASQRPGARLEFMAAALKMKITAHSAFASDSPPDAIKSDRELVQSIFRSSTAAHGVSEPVKTASGYTFFTVTDIIPSKQQSLDEVKDKVREALVAQKAQEAMMKAANDARAAIQDGLKAGKKIADIAKEKKLAISAEIEYSPSDNPNPAEVKADQQAARKALEVAAGEVSVPVNTAKGASIVIVNAKELRKRDDSATQKQNIEDQVRAGEQDDFFKVWFMRQRDDGKEKLLVDFS